MKIGIISDTHGRDLPREVFELFAGVDFILHAGDILTTSTLDELRAIAPVEAVAGNIDSTDTVNDLGRKKVISAGSTKIGLIHGDVGSGGNTPERARRAFEAERVDVVVFGHSHQPLIRQVGSVLLVNPGSATDPRQQVQPSVALLHIGPPLAAEILLLPRRALRTSLDV